ncbi:VOC family protein [Brevibacterium sp. CSND-B09]|uniref:VOC family protein n=1 Tax=Brevibacterium sp. CSND-B09 TaxID=3462571 RepID=UPI00406A23BF
MTGEAEDAGFPELLHTVIDTTEPRMLAEFYRRLLGYVYRPGDEPTDDRSSATSAEPEVPDLLVLTDASGNRKLAFQRVDRLEPTTWPATDIPMQMHLDLTVPNRTMLERQLQRAEDLGAELRVDRTDDEDEPLYVFTDPSGHPFCIFVA